jgi:N-acetylmuramidase
MKPNLIEKDFYDAAFILKCDVAAIKAVCQVEAPKGGFNPDGTPVTLFEGHKFHSFTNGKFTASHPDLSQKTWNRQFYGKTWQAEQIRLQRAMALDRDAALKSASWGKFQIMGFNHKQAGFDTVQKFINAMYKGEREHLMAFVSFVHANGLADDLARLDWAGFARGYNGPSFAANAYDKKMAAAYSKFSKET